MSKASIISKIVFTLPINSLNVSDDEVMFAESSDVPVSIDSRIPMSFRQWRDLGSPLVIEITVEPIPDE